MMMNTRFTRRGLLKASAATSLSFAMPAISRAQSRPIITHGLQSGDVDQSSGMVWARADRPSKVHMEISTTDSFKKSVKLPPLDALPESDFAVKRLLTNLPADQDIFYRVMLEDLSDVNSKSDPIIGRFHTAPSDDKRTVNFAWSGDTAGQGYGINDGTSAMLTYAAMSKHKLDFFIHSGDTIYADGPIAAEKPVPGGGIWKSNVAEGVGKVAESLAEYRGRWKYNLMDKNMLAFNLAVPTFYQWDDHEVINNWSDSKNILADARYTEKSVQLLRARASRAFHEMTPIRYTPAEPGRVYRKISYGPTLDVFFIDLRSYRNANGSNLETDINAARILGAAQVDWLKRELKASRATWKVIACDMPLSLVVWDDFVNRKGFEAVANNEGGAPLGRELEFADLFKFMKTNKIKNTVWFTADVHYTAAHYYNPNKAKFQDFEPFWEFVSGPLHAGSFGPNDLDATFGPELKFYAGPTAGQEQNQPPSAGLQFFGLVQIDGRTEQMTVRLMNRDDKELYKQVLDPVRGRD
jgi:alkaline phosphatase D